MVTKAQIIGAINNVLSDEDIADIQQAIDKRKANTKVTKIVGTVANKDWLIEGFRDLLTRRGRIKSDNDIEMHRKAHAVYLKKLPDTLRWLEQLEKTQGLNPAHRHQLALLCGQALAEYLEKIGVFQVSTMLSQVDRLPEAMDCAFPGYMASKQMGMVIKGN